jgi:hypothetical protein
LPFNLHALSCDVAREGVRRQFPEADEAEIELRLKRRLELIYLAPPAIVIFSPH